MERLDKILSEAGAASRKEARELIRAGRVTVNGTAVRRPEEKADPSAVIEIDGAPVRIKSTVTLMLNKPLGFVTSTDEPGSRTVMELIPAEYLRQGVVPAGRQIVPSRSVMPAAKAAISSAPAVPSCSAS